jgi:uncharacterized protein
MSPLRPPVIDLLVVWVTTACQLRCRYCYMQAGDGPRRDLDPGLFELALATLPVGRRTEIQISGGEPWLVPDIVTAVVERARRAGISRIGIQTNGIAVDDRFVTFVRAHGIGVGVSLDGPAEVNDATRGRTDRVLTGLQRLEAAAIPFGVTAVVTRASLASLGRLVLLLAGVSRARTLGLDVIRPTGRATASDIPDADAVESAYREVSETLAWINRRRRTPLVLREDAMVGCGRMDGYCPAERGRAATLTPDGALFPCASLVGRPDYACGAAAQPDIDKLTGGLRAAREGCADCAIPDCRGRCPSRALLSTEASHIDCALRRAAFSAISPQTGATGCHVCGVVRG